MGRLPAAERRAQLLETATKLFAERGYARATTAQLAQRAGVTEPIIYRHFKSKRDLFVALITRSGEQTLEWWRGHLEDAADPAQRLRRLLGDNPMVSAEGRDAYLVLLQAITEVDDPEIKRAVDTHVRGLHEFLQEELERAQRESRVTSKFPADLIAWVLVDIGLGFGVLSSLGIEGHGRSSDGVSMRDAIGRMLLGRRGENANDSGRSGGSRRDGSKDAKSGKSSSGSRRKSNSRRT